MNDLFINTYKKRNFVIERAEGSFVFDTTGRRYLDFLSGLATNSLGHSHPRVIKSISNQLEKVIHPSNYYYTKPQIDLAEELVITSKLDKVFFANSGTEANEAAILFLSKYVAKHPGRNEVIIFDGTFLGRTYGSRTAVRGGVVESIEFISCKIDDTQDFIKSVTAKTVAIYLELILGHGGVRKLKVETIQEVFDICREKNILIFIDEVQTGLGRTGSLYAFQEFNIKPDLVTLGKSLGGALPLSAVIVSNRVAECVEPGDYGCTMGGNSLACSAGMVLMDYLKDSIFTQTIKDKSEYISDKLNDLRSRYSYIKDIRCYGLMCGIEMDTNIVSNVLVKAIERGLLIDIVNKNTLRMLPPLTVSYEEIDTAVSIIDDILNTL